MQTKMGLLLVVFLVATGTAFWINSSWEFQDDAFITGAYARNLAAGRGWVLSPGQAPTYGTTSPLWTLLLAGASLLGAPPHLANPPLNSVIFAASAVLFALVLVELTGMLSLGILGGLAWGTALAVVFRTGGMETPLLMALFQGLVLVYLRRPERWAWQGLLAALLLLTRPDAVLLLLPVAAVQWREWRRVVKVAALTLGLCLPWAVTAWHLFGSPVPSSLLAKIATRDWYSLPFNVPRLVTLYFGESYLLWGALLALGVLAVSQNRRAPVLGIAAAVYYAAMAWGRAPGFNWYFAPLALLLYLGGFAGLARWQALPRTLVACGLLVALAAANLVSAEQVTSGRATDRAQHAVATRLRALTEPGDAVAAFEVGLIAYYSDRQVLDLLGLASPEVVAALTQPGPLARRAERVLKKTRPEWVVAGAYHDAFVRDLGYCEVATFPRGRGTCAILHKEWAPDPAPSRECDSQLFRPSPWGLVPHCWER